MQSSNIYSKFKNIVSQIKCSNNKTVKILAYKYELSHLYSFQYKLTQLKLMMIRLKLSNQANNKKRAWVAAMLNLLSIIQRRGQLLFITIRFTSNSDQMRHWTDSMVPINPCSSTINKSIAFCLQYTRIKLLLHLNSLYNQIRFYNNINSKISKYTSKIAKYSFSSKTEIKNSFIRILLSHRIETLINHLIDSRYLKTWKCLESQR